MEKLEQYGLLHSQLHSELTNAIVLSTKHREAVIRGPAAETHQYNLFMGLKV